MRATGGRNRAATGPGRAEDEMTGLARRLAGAAGIAALAAGLASAGVWQAADPVDRPAAGPAQVRRSGSTAADGGSAGLASLAVRTLAPLAGAPRSAGWQQGGLLSVSFADAADGWAVGF